MRLLSRVLVAVILLTSPTSAIPAKRYDIVLVVEGSSIIPVPITSTAPSADVANTPTYFASLPPPVSATAAIPSNHAGGPFKTSTTTLGLYSDPTTIPVVFSTSGSSPDPTDIPGLFTVGTLVVTPFLSPLQTDSPIAQQSQSTSTTKSPPIKSTQSNSKSSIKYIQSTPKSPTSRSTKRASRPKVVRGVNLGGWLLLEKWMTPDLFTGAFSTAVDQYTFDSTPGASVALQKHWSTFITASDITKLASTGINTLRIPIGYWAYNNAGTPYLKGADAFLEKAIKWARAAGLFVWIDCHGSPGSQNGFDNSGHAGPIQWQQANNLALSISVLKTIAAKYGARSYADVVLGIELVNEPASWGGNNFDTTKKWAQTAYAAVRAAASNKQLEIVMHDAFEGPAKWTDVAKSIQGRAGRNAGFAVDTHLYQLFNPTDNILTQAEHIAAACAWGGQLAAANAVMPVYVGEFSAATNICISPSAPGSTAAGTSCTEAGCECQGTTPPGQWSQAMKDQVRRYVEAQLSVFEKNSAGWFLWSAKAPGAWGFLNGIDGGWIPSPVTSRKFAGQC